MYASPHLNWPLELQPFVFDFQLLSMEWSITGYQSHHISDGYTLVFDCRGPESVPLISTWDLCELISGGEGVLVPPPNHFSATASCSSVNALEVCTKL